MADSILAVDEVFTKVEQMAAVLTLTNSKHAMDLLDEVEVGNLLGLLATLAQEAAALIPQAREVLASETADLSTEVVGPSSCDSQHGTLQ